MELKDTLQMMTSADYKERFKAEYFQLKIRFDKLVSMISKWDAGELKFSPTCPREIYDVQISAMRKYLDILEARACMEDITLQVEEL